MPVYPLKKGFQIRFERGDYVFSRNFPDLTRKQAELLESQMLVKLAMGELHQTGEDVFIVFAKEELPKWANDHWSRPDDAKKYLESFAAFFGNRSFNDISPLLIESYKLKLKKEKTERNDGSGGKKLRSEKTVNRYLAALSRVFWLAMKKKVIRENPCKEVNRYPEGEGVTRYLSDEEFERIEYALQFQPDYLRIIVVLAMNTALRWSNLINLRLEEINFSTNEIELEKTKSGHGLKVPINKKARVALENWITGNRIKKGFLFTNPKTGKPYTHIRKSLGTLLSAAKIENFTFHCFRHDALTQMVYAGYDLVTVKEIAGHRNIKTTMKYTHAKDERKHQAIDALGNRSTSTGNNVVEFKKKSG